MKSFFIKSIAIILMVGATFFMASGNNIEGFLKKALDNGKNQLNDIVNTKDVFTNERPEVLSGLLGQSNNSTSTTDLNNAEEPNISQPHSSNINKDSIQTKEDEGGDTNLKQIIEDFKSKFTNHTEKPQNESSVENDKNLPEFSIICTPDIQRKCTPSNCTNTKPTTSITLINDDKEVLYECVSGSCNSQKIIQDTVDGLSVYQPTKPAGFLLAKESSSNNRKNAYVKINAGIAETSIFYGYCTE